MLRIRVAGRPAPQGSKHYGAHGQMREASPYLPAWRAAVRNTAHRVLNEIGVPVADRPYIRGAIVVRRLVFVMLPEQPLDGQPDLDKLARGVFDALTKAGVWEDDARVRRVELLDERHPHPGELPGCIIELESFQETEQAMDGKLYRLVLEEVELNGGSPVTVGQVVGDAAMVESVLPALARRLVPNGEAIAAPTVTPAPAAGLGTGPAPQPAQPAQPDGEPAKRGRGRPRKNAAPAASPAAQPATAGAPTYDPFAAVAGQPQ